MEKQITRSAVIDGNVEDFKVENINDYLKLNDDSLRTLTIEDCDLIAYKLNRHKLYLQCKINANSSEKKKLQLALRRIISKNIGQFKGMSWENAEQCAINQDTAATDMQNKLSEVEEFLTEAWNIVSIFDDYIKRIESIKFWKRDNER